MVPTRLFDAIDYQTRNFSKEDMLVHKEDGRWRSLSTQHVGELSQRMAAGLHKLGISGNNFIGSSNGQVTDLVLSTMTA